MQVQGDHYPQPDRVQPHGQQYRADNGHHHKGNLDKVEDKAEQEDQQHHQQSGADHPAGQALEQGMHRFLAAETAKHQGKQAGADQDHEHHGGDPAGGAHYLAENLSVQVPVAGRQQQRTKRAHAGRFGGGSLAGENGAQHRRNQQQRRNQAAQQGSPAARLAIIGLKRGCPLRFQQADGYHIQEIQAHQNQAGNQRTHKQIANGHRIQGPQPLFELGFLIGVGQHITQQYQGNGGGDDLPQRAGSTDQSGGQLRLVALTQHGRQRQQAHGHHGGADDAGAGGQ